MGSKFVREMYEIDSICIFLCLLNFNIKLKIVRTPENFVKIQFFLQESFVSCSKLSNEQMITMNNKCLLFLHFLSKLINS